MQLSDAIILKAKPAGSRPRRLFDSGGLYLKVSPAGSKLWRFRYLFNGKEKRLALGAYPLTSLEAARHKRDHARELLMAGIDPGAQHKAAISLRQRESSRGIKIEKPLHGKNMSSEGGAASNSLRALGIDEREEQAYRIILVYHKATAEEVATLLSSTPEETMRRLESLENKGLAIHTSDKPQRYIATPPEFAAEFLTRQRQADLELARLNMRSMQRLSSDRQQPLEQSVEIISDPTVLNQFLRHLARSAKDEILVFERVPISYDRSSDIKVRAVMDASLLDHCGSDFIRRDVKAGKEVRFFHSLPAKLIIVDRGLAIIHLSMNSALEETCLIVRRPSGLLGALLVLFELIWESASPIAPDGNMEVDEAAPEEPGTTATRR